MDRRKFIKDSLAAIVIASGGGAGCRPDRIEIKDYNTTAHERLFLEVPFGADDSGRAKLDQILDKIQAEIEFNPVRTKQETISELERMDAIIGEYDGRQEEGLLFEGLSKEPMEFNCDNRSLIYLAISEIRVDFDFNIVRAGQAHSSIRVHLRNGSSFLWDVNEANENSIEDYRTYGASDQGIKNGVYLRDLTRDEVIGYIQFTLAGGLYTEAMNSPFKKSKLEKSLKKLEKSLEMFQLAPNSYMLKGAILSELDQSDRAIRCFQKTIELDPDYTTGHYNIGILFEKLGKYEQSIPCFDKVVELEPENSIGYFYRGIARAKVGNPRGAICDFEKVIDIDPKDRDAYMALSELYNQVGQYASARIMLNKAKKMR
ncbi:MAG: tetratricopeptide repeat protein [Nanoarchaeota archaeon]|nr:tetratricopeptide repeat protein [Nanoarchaeota archaeon]